MNVLMFISHLCSHVSAHMNARTLVDLVILRVAMRDRRLGNSQLCMYDCDSLGMCVLSFGVVNLTRLDIKGGDVMDIGSNLGTP